MLVFKVEGNDMSLARVAKELHISRTCTSDWLARYYKEGIDGVENRLKSGRPSKLPEGIAVIIRS